MDSLDPSEAPAVGTPVLGGFTYRALLIALLGVVGGYFIEEDHVTRFLLATLTLALVHGALGPIPEIGQYITGALGGLSSLFNAAAVTVIVVGTVRRLMPAG